MTSSTKRNYTTIIAAELTFAVPQKDLSGLTVPKVHRKQAQKISDLEARVFAIANETIQETLKSVRHYSNFHTWDYFRNLKSEKEVRNAAANFPSSMLPFGNCLAMANMAATGLKAALLAEDDPDIKLYADRVELATNNWHQKAKSARDYHVITMLRMHSQCIVIDLVAYGFAMKIPLSSKTNFDYRYVAVGEARLLVDYSADPTEDSANVHGLFQHKESKGKLLYGNPYRAIKGGLEGGVVNLAAPSVAYTGLPSRRSVHVYEVWDREPKAVTKTALADGTGRYLVTTFSLRINFQEHTLKLEGIPWVDWLIRPENAHLLRRLRARNGIEADWVDGPTIANWTLSLGACPRGTFSKPVLNALQLMNELCEALGMPSGELLRIANVMLEVWQKEDKVTSLKRKRDD